jgi:hypothetical protein
MWLGMRPPPKSRRLAHKTLPEEAYLNKTTTISKQRGYAMHSILTHTQH